MAEVVQLHTENADAIALIEGVAERLRSGETTSVAIVEVLRGRQVAMAWSQSADGSYHLLNSGAARLAARLALD